MSLRLRHFYIPIILDCIIAVYDKKFPELNYTDEHTPTEW